MTILYPQFDGFMKYSANAIILDDHGLFADAFSILLERYKLFDLVKSFDNKEDFFTFLGVFGHKNIVVFLDYYLGEDTGLMLLSEIGRINRKAKVIFLTSALSPFLIQTLYSYNPDGVLSKSCSVETVKQCIEDISTGKTFIDPLFKDLLHSNKSLNIKFTSREIEILQHFANGETIAQTAENMFLSSHTIVAHRRKMMAKADCQSITQLLTFAKQHGLL